MSTTIGVSPSTFGTATVPSSSPDEGSRGQLLPGDQPAGPEHEELVVLTPTRVRVDSRVVLIYCTSTWLSNCFFALLILFKLNNVSHNSWWLVFLPTWVHHSISIPLQVCVLYFHKHLVEKHIGPQPPESSSPALILQYNMLRTIRIRSHIVDATNALIDNVALLMVKLLVCYQLNYNMEMIGHTPHVHWWSFRLVFTPFWISWAATTAVAFCKDKNERVFGSARDFLYAFFLFLACKLDFGGDYSWRIVFLIPWLGFAGIFLLTLMVGILLALARVWARMSDLVLPVGFMALLVACIPQFISCVLLVRMLDQLQESGTTTVSLDAVILSNAASWFGMWVASLILVVGLRQKEHVREMLLAAGHVWTAHERLATRLANEVAETAQRRVDMMSDEEVANLVEDMMRGKTKPSMLVRVGESLYHTLSNEGTSVDRVTDIETGDEGRAASIDVKAKERCAVEPDSDGIEMMSTSPASQTLQAASLPGQITHLSMEDNQTTSEGLETVHPLPLVSAHSSGSEAAEAGEEEPGMMAPAGIPSNMSDNTCMICCDAPPTCVLLTCGHGGLCRRCANLMFVRPPNQCPTCRQRIDQIVELESASRHVGEVLRVRQ